VKRRLWSGTYEIDGQKIDSKIVANIEREWVRDGLIR
jgi:hypothetical protein